MKNVFTCLVLLIFTVGFSQSKIENKQIKVDSIGIEVTVDSVKDLESIFTETDLTTLFNTLGDNEALRFTLHCSFSEIKDNLKGSMTYSVVGNSNEKEKFIGNIKKMKSTALKFYNLKNSK
ncbi:hypothetical protein [Winogradskyella vidalii]|uniref:hypothetical protein n=1 Tax=Winogradskyella vidalii TaxID=2615024 RepID=UPI0015CCB97B|nr:hypothetical protein [Winogradskyella vidalii]